MQTMSRTRKMILSALMLTLSIVFSRFLSIKTPLLSITLNFVPITLSGVWLGPKYTVAIAGLSDIIGAILFPFGEFFIGFTISSILTGLIYGLVMYKKDAELGNKELIIRLIIANVLVILLVNMILNTLWLMIMYKKAFLVLLSTRVIKEIVMIPIEVITMFLLVQALRPIARKYLF